MSKEGNDARLRSLIAEVELLLSGFNRGNQIVRLNNLKQLPAVDGSKLTGISSGDVSGPASSINNNVVLFDGITGKLIKDSTLSLSGSNTGDNANNTQYASDYRAANFTAGTHYLAPAGNGSALTGLTQSQISGLVDALLAKAAQYGTTRSKWALGHGNGTSLSFVGWTISGIGTATTLNVATTNRYTQSPGVEYLVTVASTSAIAGWRETAVQNFMGSSAGDGGFRFICRFGLATGVSTATTRSFTGMMASAVAQTDVEPSSLVNMFGAGWDAVDTNIQFMHNDASGTATKVDLGITVPTVDRTSLYELTMICSPNSTSIFYIFADLANGGTIATGTVSTDLPAANVLLASRGSISVGGTNSVIGYGLKSVWVESNF